MTTTRNTSGKEPLRDLEYGNVVQLVDTDITGSVIENGIHAVKIIWSDGEESIETYPLIGIELV